MTNEIQENQQEIEEVKEEALPVWTPETKRQLKIAVLQTVTVVAAAAAVNMMINGVAAGVKSLATQEDPTVIEGECCSQEAKFEEL